MRPRRSTRLRAVAVVIWGLLPACGLLSEPVTPEYRAPDVAPWTELGPVEFCDGTVRLGPPESAPLGLCLAVPDPSDGPPGTAACRTDSDCRGRERCTCGVCQIALCDAPTDCAADGNRPTTCNYTDHRCDRACTTDADCGPGGACQPGTHVCRGRCSTNNDCQSGERCSGGLCALAPTCRADDDCAPGQHCVLQRTPGDLREPAPLATTSTNQPAVLYVERAMASFGARSIWRATASDDSGLRYRFDPAAPVLVPDDSDDLRAGAPTVLPPGLSGSAEHLLVYANGRGQLRRAHGDGIHFTADSQPLLNPSSGWDLSGLDAPALVAASDSPDGAFLLYYATLDGSALGLARSDDGRAFTADAQPVLTPAALTDPDHWRQVDAVASPFVEPVRLAVPGQPGQRALRVYFAARGVETTDALRYGVPSPIPPNWSIGEAGTLDGSTLAHWPYGPIYDRTLDFTVHPSERDPALLPLPDGRRLLYYRAAAADDTHPENLRAAANP